jgi:hypothetical protein
MLYGKIYWFENLRCESCMRVRVREYVSDQVFKFEEDQAMLSLPILQGCCTIQVYRKIGGSNAHPHTIVWEVCGNTLVSEAWFSVLDQKRWILKRGKLTYIFRVVKINGKTIHISMAREIVGLPRGAGHKCDESDHRNLDTFDNTIENLRVATREQNRRNRSKWGSKSRRFKGVWKHGNMFEASVHYGGKQLYLGSFKTDIEAALAHFYTGTLLHGEFFRGSEIPADEMLSEARQEEIWQLVLGKLRAAGLLAEA